jgi:hypothetical protein
LWFFWNLESWRLNDQFPPALLIKTSFSILYFDVYNKFFCRNIFVFLADPKVKMLTYSTGYRSYYCCGMVQSGFLWFLLSLNELISNCTIFLSKFTCSGFALAAVHLHILLFKSHHWLGEFSLHWILWILHNLFVCDHKAKRCSMPINICF